MNTKLEEKIKQYEKNTPISNDDELIAVIKCIISNEELLPFEERDFDLIDEAVEAILSLEKVDIEKLDNRAENITDKIISEIQSESETKIKKNKTKSARLKWLIPIAAVISLLTAGTITVYALGYDISKLVSMFSYREPSSIDETLVVNMVRNNQFELQEFNVSLEDNGTSITAGTDWNGEVPNNEDTTAMYAETGIYYQRIGINGNLYRGDYCEAINQEASISYQYNSDTVMVGCKSYHYSRIKFNDKTGNVFGIDLFDLELK